MAGVSGSTEAAEELQKKVRETVLGMKQVMEDFDQDLKRLRSTAKDESYEQALYYYRITLREIQTLLPQMADVIRRLDRYISFIEGRAEDQQPGFCIVRQVVRIRFFFPYPGGIQGHG